MRSCIAYGLFGGERRGAVIEELDLTKIGRLSFYEPDEENFPLLALAKKCGRIGGGMPAVLNAANEVAVAHFLNHEITFRQIFDTVSQVTEDLSRAAQTHDLEGILSWDREAREVTERMLIRA
jgi:1-deoxy-D-xylulose-5-phosphate reductoisomerase